MTREDIYDKALSQYGIAHQRTKCIEELSELAKELCKEAIGEGSVQRIADEIADVLITTGQMIRYYGLGTIVDSRIVYKLDRLERGMNRGNEL